MVCIGSRVHLPLAQTPGHMKAPSAAGEFVSVPRPKAHPPYHSRHCTDLLAHRERGNFVSQGSEAGEAIPGLDAVSVSLCVAGLTEQHVIRL